MRDNIPVTLIADTMVGYVLSKGLVDKVVEVRDLDKESIEPNPNIPSYIPMEYIIGVDSTNEDMTILINLRKILSREELINVDGSRFEKVAS